MNDRAPWGPLVEHAHVELLLGVKDEERVAHCLRDQATTQGFSVAEPGGTSEDLLEPKASQAPSGLVLLGLPASTCIPRFLSERLDCVVISVTVLYGNSWQYDLHQGGEYLDRHWSCPDMSGLSGSEGSQEKFLASFLGTAAFLGRAVGSNPELLKPYLVQVTEAQIDECRQDRRAAEHLKAYPDDRHTLAGAWAWTDLLRRTGHPDWADYCIRTFSGETSDPTPTRLDSPLRGDLLEQVDHDTWHPPLCKPLAQFPG